MKKFLVLLVLTLVSVTTFAFDKAATFATVKQAVTSKNLTTYESIKVEVESIINATDATPWMKKYLSEYLTTVYTGRYGNSEEFKKAFTALRTEKNPTIFEFISRAKNVYGWTDEETYNFTVQQFKELRDRSTISVWSFTKGAEIIINYAPTVNVTTQKADLQLLNRLASDKLLKDKVTWEPIVARIRTALETY